jgi:hypothetical protein
MARPRMFCRGGAERAGMSASNSAAPGSPRRPLYNAVEVHSTVGGLRLAQASPQSARDHGRQSCSSPWAPRMQ